MENVEEALLGKVKYGEMQKELSATIVDGFTKELTNIPKNIETGKSKALENVDDNSAYNILDVAEPKHNLGYLGKLYDISPYHASAIDAKIDNSVGLGYTFELTRLAEKKREETSKKTKLAQRKLEEALDDGREQLGIFWESLNGLDEFEQTLMKFVQDYFTMGNGYLELGRDSKGQPNYLGHIPATHVRIRNKRDGFVQYTGGKYVFFRNYGENSPDPFGEDKNPNEIIHLRKYSSTDDYYGVPEAVSIINAISGMEFAQRYNIEYFENKAVPRYIIKTKGLNLSPSDQADLLNFFETSTKGQHHRTIMIPLPGGDKDISFEPVESREQDSSWNTYIKENIQFITARHRVPPGRIGISSAASSQGETEMAERGFKESVCRPIQTVVQKKLNKIVQEITDLFQFRLKEFALTDEDRKSQIHERYLRWGVVLPDEVRNELSMQPRPDGKGMEPLDQATLAEIGATEAANQNKAEQKTQAYANRTRDQERSSSSTDSATSTQTRNSKGEGRKTGT